MDAANLHLPSNQAPARWNRPDAIPVTTATTGTEPRQIYGSVENAVQLLLKVLKGNKVHDVDTGVVVYASKNIGDYVVASKEQEP